MTTAPTMIDNTSPGRAPGFSSASGTAPGAFSIPGITTAGAAQKARMRFKPSMRPYNANFTRGNDTTLPTCKSLLYERTGGKFRISQIKHDTHPPLTFTPPKLHDLREPIAARTAPQLCTSAPLRPFSPASPPPGTPRPPKLAAQIFAVPANTESRRKVDSSRQSRQGKR